MLLAIFLSMLQKSEPITGWYRFDDGSERLLTYAAEGGFRLAEFKNRTFETIEQKPDGSYVYRHSVTTKMGPIEFPLKLEHGTFDSAKRGKKMANPPYTVSSVIFNNEGATLAATILLPTSKGSHPGAVVIHGSGTSHRNNMWYLWQADYLAKHGVAVLLPDKRGSGSSTGDWKKVGFDTLARDAAAGAKVLDRVAGVNRKRMGFFGLSQGGWIAPVAAQVYRSAAFVVSVSSAAVRPIDQVDFEVRNNLKEAGLPEAQIEQGMELQHEARLYIEGGPWETYRQALGKAKASSIAKLADDYPSDEHDWGWAWWRRILNFDPVAEWRKAKVRTLVAYGEKDELDNVPVKRSIERLKALSNVRVDVFPGLGHAMADADSGWISPQYMDAVCAFIKHR